jgi:hypothetical protein
MRQINGENVVVFASGGKLVEEYEDGSQRVLDIFDNDISSIDISNDNKWIVIGQVGTQKYKENKAFVALISREDF